MIQMRVNQDGDLVDCGKLIYVHWKEAIGSLYVL